MTRTPTTSPSVPPDPDSRGRVAFSSVPDSREARVSPTRLVGVSASALDRLLVASCESPISEGEVAVVEHMVRALGDVFPQCAVGACLVPASVSSPQLGAHVEQRVFTSLPCGEEHRIGPSDPTRLFSSYAYERVLTAEAQGTTLHIASDDRALEDDDSPLMHVAQRAALVLGRKLWVSRIQAKATSAARDLRALNSHMVQAEKLASLGQIAAGVVHELNNPLTSIVAYTDWLLRKVGPSGDPDSLERLRRIGESAGRILRFTRDLVAYARPSSEVPVPVSIHTVLDQALAFCEHVIAEHGVSVVRAYGEAVPSVRGMPEQLAQVFVNLFTNACHAVPGEGGELVVSTSMRLDGRAVLVTVEDNGHGIPLAHEQQIFTPFFTTKADGRGTGLGLSIVKNIVDGHEGEIHVERRPAGGSRFVLAFPVP
jgi:two-component system NtrC family sensor kinase